MASSEAIKKNIVVLGAGSWGAALAHQLRQNPALHVSLIARSPQDTDWLAQGRIRQLPDLPPVAPLQAVTDITHLSDAELIILAAPVSAHLQACSDITRYAPADCPVVFCAKGLIADAAKGGIFLCEYGAAHLSSRPLAMLTGPSFADEVLSDLPAALLAASTDADLRETIASLFEPSCLRIYQGADIIGAAVGGAAKNVIAIAAGIVAGKGFGDNARAALVTRGLAEIMRLASAAGGQTATISGLAGLGDLLLSCASTHSRNMAFGYQLGAGDALPSHLSEGRFATSLLCARAEYEGVEMPLAQAVNAILNHNAPLTDTIKAILSRTAYSE